jgi:hypothetical protein
VSFASFAYLCPLGLFAGMLLFLDIGRRLGVRSLAKDPEGALAGTSAVDGAVFALLGLLTAFTFSGAADRFDERRGLIIEETNAIGTAYLRLDVLPDRAQPPLRDLFRRYVDSRLETYERFADVDWARAGLARSSALQGEIWSKAVAATKMEGVPPSASVVLLPALNTMIDITTTRTLDTERHPPMVIFVMLFALALASAALAGYEMAGRKGRSWIHMLSFATVTAVAVYVIIDLEYPRRGLIRVDAFDHALVDLRRGMDSR